MKIRRALLLIALTVLLGIVIRPAYSGDLFQNKPLVLKSGMSIECDMIWEGLGDYIWYQKSLGIVGYPFNDVDLTKTFGPSLGEVIAKRYKEKLKKRSVDIRTVLFTNVQTRNLGYEERSSGKGPVTPDKTQKEETSGDVTVKTPAGIYPREPNP
jgi:hypothetical protein